MAKKAVGESSVEREALGNLTREKTHPLVRYACGHVGKETGEKARAFIQWAEVRNYKVVELDAKDKDKKCPNCK